LEKVHAAAWGNGTLGLPRYCPPENIDNITRDHILSYMKTYFRPPRIVVSGVGVEHNELVDLTKMYFENSKSAWDENDFNLTGPSEPDQSVAKYTGGYLKEEKDFGQFNSGPLPVPNLAHIALGLESVTHHDPDFISSCVLNIMMGGGGSFSAGGPGKGMYSRLYLNVLNQYHWIYNATAYNNSYGDSGLFCIYASSPPGNLKNLVNVLVKELASMTGPISQEEFMRSKTQLKSMLLMNLETRPIVFEDIGRQVLANNQYRTPEEYIRLIDNVKMEDVDRLTRRLVSSKPCIAAMGNLQKLPSLDEITSDMADYVKRIGQTHSQGKS
jgi:processing peptidase subunit alpha